MQKFALELSDKYKKMKVSLHSVTNNRRLEIHMDSKSWNSSLIKNLVSANKLRENNYIMFILKNMLGDKSQLDYERNLTFCLNNFSLKIGSFTVNVETNPKEQPSVVAVSYIILIYLVKTTLNT